MHIILKPGKGNGALSERNRAGKHQNFINSYYLQVMTIFKSDFQLPVRGVKTKGETTLANEQTPEMHPCAFPWYKGKGDISLLR